jgi:hypothetical protein
MYVFIYIYIYIYIYIICDLSFDERDDATTTIELIDSQKKLTAISLKTPRIVQDTTTFPINDIMDRVFGKVVSPATVCDRLRRQWIP